jgi:2OG-Fe(II) oxygenase superfamily
MDNFKVVQLHEDIWYIDDFLGQEELAWFKTWCDDPNDWYTTMRSPYKNILNKFINVEPKYDENGNVMIPDHDSVSIDFPVIKQIWQRLEQVLPKHYRPHATLQTFKYMTDEEIEANLQPDLDFEKPLNFAMQIHEDPTENVNASFSLYLNDDFEGGELEFIDIPVKIEPKAGRLVVIITKSKLQHRVNKIKSGNSRHTLYGNCWNDSDNIPMSTAEDC